MCIGGCVSDLCGFVVVFKICVTFITCALVVGFDKVDFERRSAVINTLEIIFSTFVYSSVWLLLSLCQRRCPAQMCVSDPPLSPFIQRKVRDAPSSYHGRAQISFSLRIIHTTRKSYHFQSIDLRSKL